MDADDALVAVRQWVTELTKVSWRFTILETLWLSDATVITDADAAVWKEITEILKKIEQTALDRRFPLVIDDEPGSDDDDDDVEFAAPKREPLPCLQIPSVIMLHKETLLNGNPIRVTVSASPRTYGHSVLRLGRVKGETLPPTTHPIRLLPNLISFLEEWAAENVVIEPKSVIKSELIINSNSTERSTGSHPISATTSRYRRDFEEICCLGKGGFGSVMKCRLTAVAGNQGGEFAVKVIRLVGDDKSCSTLLREAATIAALQHPNIVRYYSAWVETDPGETSTAPHPVSKHEKHVKLSSGCSRRLYILMECCNGKTLREAINAGDLCHQPDLIWSLFRQILDALEFMHSRHIMHRDLKPCNILLQPTSSADLVRIGDFGLSTSFEAAAAANAGNNNNPPVVNNKKGDILLSAGVGTKLYMAPEQEAGGAYDAKVDMFSLGIIFFEMWHPPFSTAMERTTVLEKVRNRDFDKNLSIGKRAMAILEALLHPDPKSRPSATELLQSNLLPRQGGAAFDAAYDTLVFQPFSPESLSITKKFFESDLLTTNHISHDNQIEDDFLKLQWTSKLIRDFVELSHLRRAVLIELPVILPHLRQSTVEPHPLIDIYGVPLQFAPSLLSAVAALSGIGVLSPVLSRRYAMGGLSTSSARTCFVITARVQNLLEADCRETIHTTAAMLSKTFLENEKVGRSALRLLFYAIQKAGKMKQQRSQSRVNLTTRLLSDWLAADKFLTFPMLETISMSLKLLQPLKHRLVLIWTHLLFLPALIASAAPPSLEPAQCISTAAVLAEAVQKEGVLTKHTVYTVLRNELESKIDKRGIQKLSDAIFTATDFKGGCSLQDWLTHNSVLSEVSPLLALLMDSLKRFDSCLSGCPFIVGSAAAYPSSSSSSSISIVFSPFLPPDPEVPHAPDMAFAIVESSSQSSEWTEDALLTNNNINNALLNNVENPTAYATIITQSKLKRLISGGRLSVTGNYWSHHHHSLGDPRVDMLGIEVRLDFAAKALSATTPLPMDWGSKVINKRVWVVISACRPELLAYGSILRRLLRRAGVACVRNFICTNELPAAVAQQQMRKTFGGTCGFVVQLRENSAAIAAGNDPVLYKVYSIERNEGAVLVVSTTGDPQKVVEYFINNLHATPETTSLEGSTL